MALPGRALAAGLEDDAAGRGRAFREKLMPTAMDRFIRSSKNHNKFYVHNPYSNMLSHTCSVAALCIADGYLGGFRDQDFRKLLSVLM